MCAIWQPTYILQERYQVLQTYLGIQEYKRIVPNTALPKTAQDELNDQARDEAAAEAAINVPTAVMSPSPQLHPSSLTSSSSNDLTIQTTSNSM